MAQNNTTQTVTNSEQNALLNAIIAAPAEDTPRLVYADYLDECQNHDRAQLIRAQVQMARLSEYSAEYDELESVSSSLLAANVVQWAAELGLPAYRFTYRRGFAEVATVTPVEFASAAKILFAKAPIQGIRFRPPELMPEADWGFGSTQHNQPLPRDWLWPILSVPELGRVTEFDFAMTAVVDSHVAEILRSPRTRPITSLNFDDTSHLTTAAVEVMASSPALTALQELSVVAFGGGQRSGTAVLGPMEMRILARSPHLRKIFVLWIGMNAIRDAGAVEIAAAGWPLRKLSAYDNRITATGFTAIAASRFLGELEELELGWNRGGDDGIEAIARSDGLPGLTVLDLQRTRLRDRGAQALIQSKTLASVRAIHLRNPSLSYKSLFALHDAFGDRLHMDY